MPFLRFAKTSESPSRKYLPLSDGVLDYSKIRSLEIELGFEPYPELPKAQIYSGGAPTLAVVDQIFKEMYAVPGKTEVYGTVTIP